MSWKLNNKCVYLRYKWIQLGETDCLYGLVIYHPRMLMYRLFHRSPYFSFIRVSAEQTQSHPININNNLLVYFTDNTRSQYNFWSSNVCNILCCLLQSSQASVLSKIVVPVNKQGKVVLYSRNCQQVGPSVRHFRSHLSKNLSKVVLEYLLKSVYIS
jgi:hypothetical protein